MKIKIVKEQKEVVVVTTEELDMVDNPTFMDTEGGYYGFYYDECFEKFEFIFVSHYVKHMRSGYFSLKDFQDVYTKKIRSNFLPIPSDIFDLFLETLKGSDKYKVTEDKVKNRFFSVIKSLKIFNNLNTDNGGA